MTDGIERASHVDAPELTPKRAKHRTERLSRCLSCLGLASVIRDHGADPHTFTGMFRQCQ